MSLLKNYQPTDLNLHETLLIQIFNDIQLIPDEFAEKDKLASSFDKTSCCHPDEVKRLIYTQNEPVLNLQECRKEFLNNLNSLKKKLNTNQSIQYLNIKIK
jgi:hypothetical protein